MTRRSNKFPALCAALLWLLLCIPSADASVTGSLEIDDVLKPVQLYAIHNDSGELYPDFVNAEEIVKEMSSNSVATAKKLADFARKQNCTPVVQTPDQDGIVFFGSLNLGLYLICSADGEFSPFLMDIPLVIDGEVLYYVAAKPKIEDIPEPEPTETVPQESHPSETENRDPAIPQTGISEIPQTGISVVPKYMLMGLGTAITLLGLWEILRGREDAQ